MQKKKLTAATREALELLRALIKIPSFSAEEDGTAQHLEEWMASRGMAFHRDKNNVWAVNKYFNPEKPTILLNSHHDTVRPNAGYTRDPFDPAIEGEVLYGLGSNDAGASLVSLLAAFAHFYEEEDLRYNLLIAATAEEESSGEWGLKYLIHRLPEIDFAIVGEPTGMQLAIAEKGLLVIDGYASGIAGHAAHENTENAIYQALEDIHWIRTHRFDKVSETLGKVKMSVTQIQAGKQHNLVPARCHFVVDVRVNDAYTNREVFDIIDAHTKSRMEARSFQLNSSSISPGHPIVKAGIRLGRKTYGSPTLSDQAVLSCPSLKMGPGQSTRSHSADEFIRIDELNEGVQGYIDILEEVIRSSTILNSKNTVK